MPVSPPRPKGPPLNALRAFEADARLRGFAAASDELCVTPGAVSQQVKALEDWTNAPLFERRSQGVVLRPFGARVADEFRVAFDQLDAAQCSLRANALQKSIMIAAMPSVAQLWLSPRMPAIRANLPEYAISITALETPPNLRRDLFDMSIFIGERSGRAIERVLVDDILFPVCTPAIASRLKVPADLLNETLLFDALWKSDWQVWLEHAGVPAIGGKDGPTFSLYSLALEEARNGAGVLIGHEALVEAPLQSGDLVAPFRERARSGKALILETAAPVSEAVECILDRLLA